MIDFSKKYLFRMVHIKNMNHISKFGITHINSKYANKEYFTIGDNSIINTRKTFRISINQEKNLGDFIPFYFGKRMPMLYVIQNGYNSVKSTHPQDIVYCVTSIQKIVDLKIPFIFTDGHAINFFTSFYTIEHINEIDSLLDFKAINSSYWKVEEDLDFKRRKEAEFLIENDLPIEGIIGYIVYNQLAKKTLINLGIDKNIIHVNSNYYF